MRPDTSTLDKVPQEQFLRNFLLTAPLILAVPLLFVVVYSLFDIELQWKAIGFGALGWLVALALRGPVAMLITKFIGTSERAKLWLGGASGPLEESVRLVVLALVGVSFPTVMSIGLGWAAIEVLFVIVNGAVVISLMRRTDEKAAEARRQLEAQGLLEPNHSFWGISERIFASAGHIGFTLLLAAHPLLVLFTIPAHSVLNLGIVRLVQSSMVRAQLALAVLGSALLVIGLAVYNWL